MNVYASQTYERRDEKKKIPLETGFSRSLYSISMLYECVSSFSVLNRISVVVDAAAAAICCIRINTIQQRSWFVLSFSLASKHPKNSMQHFVRRTSEQRESVVDPKAFLVPKIVALQNS